jgi:FdhD protein
LALTHCDIVRAANLLNEAQPLHRETRAVHGAGFYIPGQGLSAVREDVGRHNALDKLCGAVIRSGNTGIGGAVVVTSRISVEMVQKTAILGASILIAISAPTALAIRTAEDAGMTLVALVRGDDFEIFTHPHRISPESIADVA